MEESKVIAAARDVADKLDSVQEMLRKGQFKLCEAYLESVHDQGPLYWYAMCMLLCQGIVEDTPTCPCPRHGGGQIFDAVIINASTGQMVTDPLYAFSTEIIQVFARHDWAGFVDRLKHVVSSGRAVALTCLLTSRLTQLQDQKAAGLL